MALLLTDSLRHADRLFGRHVGVVCGQTHLTYADFANRCRRLASGLRQLGIQPGDRVAVLMANCHRLLETYYAVPALGAIIVPLNTRLSPVELRAILDDCRPALLLYDQQNGELGPKLAGHDLPLLEASDAYERLVAANAPLPLTDEVDEDAPAAIFYTGGTSGTPKGAILSHRNLVANSFNMTIGAEYNESDRFLHTAPMFHLADGSSIYALTWRGARHVILRRFDPAAVLETIERERISCTIMVPAMLHAIVNHPDVATRDLSSLRVILHGGAPITSSLLHQAVKTLGCSFTQAYGLTEGSSHIAMLPHEERLLADRRVASAGRAVMGTEVVTRRADGAACASGEIGEVTVRGSNVTTGYWQRPDATAAALRDGWFWTGDLGYLDDDGYIFLVDRVKDMIISGGENVYSIEVEDVLCQHPGVASAAVIGVPDPAWGERVHAVLIARPGWHIDLAELRAFCTERIASYKSPRSIEIVDALPASGAGKVLKRTLRERHRGEQQKAV